MDTNTWEYYVPCSRLKTKQRKRRLQKTDADKNLICLYKQLNKICDEIRNLGYEELVPPVQRGWKRTFVLRPDLEKSKDADFFKSLLEKINTIQYCPRRNFKIKKKRRGKKVYVERPQFIKDLQEFEYQRKIITDKGKSFFKEEWDYSFSKTRPFKKYVFTEPWKFILKIEPNMITKVKILDPLLLQQQAEIEKLFVQRNLYARLNSLTAGHNTYRYRWNLEEKNKYKFLQKIHAEEMNENKQIQNRNDNTKIKW